MNVLRLVRYSAWALVGAVALAIVLYVFVPLTLRTDAVTIGGPFTLTDQTGTTVTEAALKGHPSLIFFGFTFCPDVCPTTLLDATNWMRALGSDADKLRVYFVTVDPERDTREAMAQYLSAFDPRIVGLTGSRPAIDQTLKAFRIYSRKVPAENGGSYTMDHNASVYMFDADARFAGAIAYQEPEEEVLPKLRKLIGSP